MTSRSHTFHPPGPVGEWPKTVADVGDSFMRHTLKDDFYGPGAVGSIISTMLSFPDVSHCKRQSLYQ
jgi:hypothetical protein